MFIMKYGHFKEIKICNDVSKLDNVPEYRLARIRRYQEFANPPLRSPSKLVPITIGVMIALYAFIGMYPKLIDKGSETFDDPMFTDRSDRLVNAVFDEGSYSWKKTGITGILVPESICKSKR